jgi:parallel beta-helix repeat protein
METLNFRSKRRQFLISLLLSALILTSGSNLLAQPCELYVAEDGKDSWSGLIAAPNAETDDGPVATLQMAQRMVRRLKQRDECNSGFIVNIRKGYYELSNTFKLSSIDSGSPDSPILYRNYKDEKVIISGGKRLYNSMPYSDHVFSFDTNEQGLGSAKISQLFYNGQRQTLARWPNKNPDDVHDGQWAYVLAVDSDRSHIAFKYQGNRPARWKKPYKCQINLYPNFNWWHVLTDVESIDTGNKYLTLSKKLPYPIKPGRRFYFQNVFEELDAPGEWYFNSNRSVLYFWPPDNSKDNTILVPVLETVIDLQNVSYVTFNNLIIEGSNGDAVTISNGRNNSIVGCTVRNAGGVGILLSDGTANGVRDSEIYDTGKGALILSGGNRKSLTAAENFSVNNHIHHYGQIYKFLANGCTLKGVGNIVAHNSIHDGPDIALRIYGNDHLIEYNEIFDVCLNLSDTGAIYIGRDWTQRGNIIRYNKIHDIYGFGLNNAKSGHKNRFLYEKPYQAWGIYLDDCTSGTLIFGNIIYRVPLGGILVGGGRDNTIENNIFSGCIPAIFIGARSIDLFARLKPVLSKRLNDMNFEIPPYSLAYPELASLKRGDQRKPSNNKFIRNIAIYSDDDYAGLNSMEKKDKAAVVYYLHEFDAGTSEFRTNLIWHDGLPVRIHSKDYYSKKTEILSWQKWTRAGFDAGSNIGDPLFEGSEIGDFVLKKHSAAWEIGFNEIPINKIGLYPSEERPVLPTIKNRDNRAVKRMRYTIDISKLK